MLELIIAILLAAGCPVPKELIPQNSTITIMTLDDDGGGSSGGDVGHLPPPPPPPIRN